MRILCEVVEEELCFFRVVQDGWLIYLGIFVCTFYCNKRKFEISNLSLSLYLSLSLSLSLYIYIYISSALKKTLNTTSIILFVCLGEFCFEKLKIS